MNQFGKLQKAILDCVTQNAHRIKAVISPAHHSKLPGIILTEKVRFGAVFFQLVPDADSFLRTLISRNHSIWVMVGDFYGTTRVFGENDPPYRAIEVIVCDNRADGKYTRLSILLCIRSTSNDELIESWYEFIDDISEPREEESKGVPTAEIVKPE